MFEGLNLMFAGLYFEFPKLLFVWFVYLACETLCKMRLPSLYFPHTRRFSGTTASVSRLLLFLKWLGITMLVFAVMSPVKDTPLQVKPEKGYDIALVLDTSFSMRAQKFDPDHPERNRFEAVQAIVGDFISRRTSDNLGIVVFGDYSFVATPLTYDRNILAKVVEQLSIGMAGKATALYEALAQSVNLLHGAQAKSRIAILLTDGFNTARSEVSLDTALELAKKEGVRVYTIGIGNPGEYNGPLLEHMAKETGGRGYAARTAEELQQVYDAIDTLEKSEIETNSYSYKRYYYLYPLFVALLSLLLYVYLRNKRGWA